MDNKANHHLENNPQDTLAQNIREKVKGLSEREVLCLCCRIISGWQLDNGCFGEGDPSDKPMLAILKTVHQDLHYHRDGVG